MNPANPVAPPANKLLFYLAHIVGCLLLLIPAFYNGFGILNSDFGTYLPSGFKPEMPVDRPITYGILLRIFSLNGLSLWLVIIAQAFFVSNLIIRLIKHITGNKNYPLFSIVIIAFLSLGTGLSWTVSQLQPDIYTSIALMCASLLIISDENKTVTILTYILYFVSIGTHASHLVLFVLLLLTIIIFYRKTIFRQQKKKILLLVLLSVAPILTMLPIFDKSKHMFFMASLLEKGILKRYLDDNCGTKQYKLCAYKDELPASADDFLWESYSPLYKEGGRAAVKPEYDNIISDVMGSPQYLWLFTKSSAGFTCKQLTMFEIGPGNVVFKEGTYVYDGMKLYVPNDIANFSASRQQQGTLLSGLDTPNNIFYVVMILSAVLLVVLSFFYVSSSAIKFFIFVCVAGIILNAWDCATFSVLNGRYGCRMMWLLPFSMLLHFISSRYKKI